MLDVASNYDLPNIWFDRPFYFDSLDHDIRPANPALAQGPSETKSTASVPSRAGDESAADTKWTRNPASSPSAVGATADVGVAAAPVVPATAKVPVLCRRCKTTPRPKLVHYQETQLPRAFRQRPRENFCDFCNRRPMSILFPEGYYFCTSYTLCPRSLLI